VIHLSRSLAEDMAKAKRIFRLRERREKWRITLGRQTERGVCPECGEETGWLTAAESSHITELGEREIFRLTEKGKLHFREAGRNRALFICSRSLSSFLDLRQFSDGE
jgi:hypothetical protein